MNIASYWLKIGIGLFLFSNVHAEEKAEQCCPKKLTVLDAITLTLNYQREIQIRNEEIGVQAGLLRQAGGPFDYYISNRAMKTYLKDVQIINNPCQINVTKTYTSQVDSSVTKKSRLGTELSFVTEVAHIHTKAIPSVNGGDATVAQVAFLLNQPLLRNFRYGLEVMNEHAQRLEVSAAWYTAAYFISNSVTNTVTNYWEAVAAKKLIEIQKETKEQYLALAERTRALIKALTIAPNDLNLILAQIAIQDVNILVAEQQYYLAIESLKLAMGVGDECCINSADDDFPAIQEGPNQDNCELLMGIIRRLSRKRLDILSSQISAEATALRLKGSENNSLPQLDVFARLNIGPLASQVPSAPFPDSFNQVNFSSGVVFSTPLYNDAALGLVQQRRAELAQRRLMTERLREQAAVQFLQAWASHFYLIAQLKEADREIETNRLIVANEMKKLNAGYSSVFFVLNYQNQLNTSLIQRLEIYKQYTQNIVLFRFAAGLLLTLDEGSNEFQIESVTDWPRNL